MVRVGARTGDDLGIAVAPSLGGLSPTPCGPCNFREHCGEVIKHHKTLFHYTAKCCFDSTQSLRPFDQLQAGLLEVVPEGARGPRDEVDLSTKSV